MSVNLCLLYLKYLQSIVKRWQCLIQIHLSLLLQQEFCSWAKRQLMGRKQTQKEHPRLNSDNLFTWKKFIIALGLGILGLSVGRHQIWKKRNEQNLVINLHINSFIMVPVETWQTTNVLNRSSIYTYKFNLMSCYDRIMPRHECGHRCRNVVKPPSI